MAKLGMPPPPPDIVLDAALALSDEIGWPRLHLHRIADDLGVPLEQVLSVAPTLDALANAWLARADAAMLARGEDADVPAMAPPDRLQASLSAWFAALAPRRATLRAILLYKLEPAHLHLQAALVVATSRRVQQWREVARLDAHAQRQSRQEAVLTGIFVAAVLSWVLRGHDDPARALKAAERRLRRFAGLFG